MSWLKVLGGVAAGVGTVAVLPVAGPIGAVTATGAAIGALVGGSAGLRMKKSDDKKEEKYKKQDEDIKVQRAKTVLAEEEIKEGRKLCAVLISGFALGLAAANADGTICQRERDEIAKFIAGLEEKDFPKNMQKTIDDLYKNPPSLNTALAMINKSVEDPDWNFYKGLVEDVIIADEEISVKEQAFIEAFERAVIHFNDEVNTSKTVLSMAQ